MVILAFIIDFNENSWDGKPSWSKYIFAFTSLWGLTGLYGMIVRTLLVRAIKR